MRIKLLAVCGLLFVLMGVCSAETDVTPMDIQTVKTKLNSANPYFREVWSQVFAGRGLSFQPPAIKAFSGTVSSACGKIEPGNGLYCSGDDTIYLDAQFLAQLMKDTAEHNKTDGDYAAIVVAAHEFGHQVARQLGSTGSLSFTEEQQADCLAGAVTRQARIDGYLEPGDLQEARYALAISGDLTAIRGSIGELANESEHTSHGSPAQRVNSFDRGYYVGPPACTDKLGVPGVPPAGGVIASDYIGQTKAGVGAYCVWSPTFGGLKVSSISQSDVCELRFGGGLSLPADFRVELTARPIRGKADQCYGLLVGQRDNKDPLVNHYVFCVAPQGYSLLGTQNAFNAKGIVDLLNEPFWIRRENEAVAAGWDVENHLIVDVHRTEDETVVLGYINGRFVEMGRSLQAPQGPVGVYVGGSPMEVLVTGLRILRLSE